jgi:hypothetical protein
MNSQLSVMRIGIFVIFAVNWSSAFSQIDRSAYRDSTIDEVIAEHSLRVGSSKAASKDTALIAPEYKYRLRLRSTGHIRNLTPDMMDAVSAWSRTNPDLPAFLKEYTQEVEVVVEDKSVWLIWQRSLVAPFRAERGSGGDIDVYAILAGVFHGKLLLFATAFESVG